MIKGLRRLLFIAVCVFVHTSAFLLDDWKKHCQNCYDCECNDNKHPDCNEFFGRDSCEYCHTGCQNKPTGAPEQTKTSICDKIGIIDAIARSVHAVHPSSRNCGQGSTSKHQPEALVQSFCNAPRIGHWRPGKQVIPSGASNCTTDDSVYTPVMHFLNGHPISASVLIGCSKNELKLVYQDCNKTPKIYHLHEGNKIANIHDFRVLNWT